MELVMKTITADKSIGIHNELIGTIATPVRLLKDLPQPFYSTLF
jgi:hypothetical protein